MLFKKYAIRTAFRRILRLPGGDKKPLPKIEEKPATIDEIFQPPPYVSAAVEKPERQLIGTRLHPYLNKYQNVATNRRLAGSPPEKKATPADIQRGNFRPKRAADMTDERLQQERHPGSLLPPDPTPTEAVANKSPKGDNAYFSQKSGSHETYFLTSAEMDSFKRKLDTLQTLLTHHVKSLEVIATSGWLTSSQLEIYPGRTLKDQIKHSKLEIQEPLPAISKWVPQGKAEEIPHSTHQGSTLFFKTKLGESPPGGLGFHEFRCVIADLLYRDYMKNVLDYLLPLNAFLLFSMTREYPEIVPKSWPLWVEDHQWLHQKLLLSMTALGLRPLEMAAYEDWHAVLARYQPMGLEVYPKNIVNGPWRNRLLAAGITYNQVVRYQNWCVLNEITGQLMGDNQLVIYRF